MRTEDNTRKPIQLTILINFLLSIFLLFVGCTVHNLPRDEIEVYQAGIDFWKNGQYETAIRILTPFAEKDTLYMPLYTVFADCYYRLNRYDEVLNALEKSADEDETGIVRNLRKTFQAKDNRVIDQQERVNFPQYLEDVANRYALDKALLYAMIREGSSFRLDGDSNEYIGLVGLNSRTAKEIGLTISDRLRLDNLAIFDEDERLDPVKSIYYTARYIHTLLEQYRFGTKNSDLIKALTVFYNPQADSLNLDRMKVDNVLEYFLYYRHNTQRQEEASRQFYEQNMFDENPFTSTLSLIPDEKQNEVLNAYKETELNQPMYFIDPVFQASYYNNIALVCDMLNDHDNAELFYQKARYFNPNDEVILQNYGLFLFDQGQYENAYDTLKFLHPREVESINITVIRSFCLLFLDRIDELAQFIEPHKDRKEPHLLNLWGLLLFRTGNFEDSADAFYKAYEISREPIFAANFLAASFQSVFNSIAYAEITKLNKITRQYDTGFIWPVDLRYISSGYGWRPNPFSRNWRRRLENLDFHNGIDLPGHSGLPVRASANGEVMISERFPMGGETIFVKHPDGYITTYLHLESRFVKVSDSVEQGDIIGLLGNTGQSTGPHLHFGMFNNKNQSVNPLNYLPVY